MAQSPQHAKPHAQHSFVKWQTIAAAAGTLALGVGAYLYAMPLPPYFCCFEVTMPQALDISLFFFALRSVLPPFSESPSTIVP